MKTDEIADLLNQDADGIANTVWRPPRNAPRCWPATSPGCFTPPRRGNMARWPKWSIVGSTTSRAAGCRWTGTCRGRSRCAAT
jgi:hypothetical protein